MGGKSKSQQSNTTHNQQTQYQVNAAGADAPVLTSNGAINYTVTDGGAVEQMGDAVRSFLDANGEQTGDFLEFGVHLFDGAIDAVTGDRENRDKQQLATMAEIAEAGRSETGAALDTFQRNLMILAGVAVLALAWRAKA